MKYYNTKKLNVPTFNCLTVLKGNCFCHLLMLAPHFVLSKQRINWIIKHLVLKHHTLTKSFPMLHKPIMTGLKKAVATAFHMISFK